MILPEHLARVYVQLVAHYEAAEEERGRHIRSRQSADEAQLEMRAKLHRCHGFGCGHSAHPTGGGTEGGRRESEYIRVHPQPQMQRPALIATALRSIDDARVLHRLELLAAAPLPASRRPFGGAFPQQGSGTEARNERMRAPHNGIAQNVEHGPGILAHLTDLAAIIDVDALGRTVGKNASKGGVADRALVHRIAAQARTLALAALEDLAAAAGNVDRRSTLMRRAG